MGMLMATVSALSTLSDANEISDPENGSCRSPA